MIDKRLIIICCAYAVDPLVMMSFNPLVSVLKTTFNVNVELIALGVTFHMLPLSILCFFSGTISDMFYRPKMLMYGLFLSCIGSLINFISPNITVFLLSRSIQGAASALIMPIAIALIGDITPREQLGRAMGFALMFMSAVSAILGPLVSGFLAGINWRLVPLYLVAYCVVVGILCRIILIGIVAPQKKGSISLVFQQIRKTANRNILLLSATGFIAMFCWAGVQPLISNILSLPPLLVPVSEIGVIFSIVGFVGALFSFLGGVLNDRLGGRNNMIIGLLLMMLPMFLLTYANSLWLYLILLPAVRCFNGLSGVSRSALVVGSAPEARGSASSMLQFASYLGFSLAPIILTQIYMVWGMNSVYLTNVFLLLLSVLFIFLVRLEKKS